MSIRESTPEDVPAFDRIRQACYSWHFSSLAAQRNWRDSIPPQSRLLMLTAEVEGEVTGYGVAALNPTTTEPGVGFAVCVVHPDFRKRGVGAALYERLEAHLEALDVRRAQGNVLDQPDIIAWAEARGWSRGASSRYSAVDPNNLPPMPPIPTSTTIVDLATLTPEAVYELDMAAAADMPGDVAYGGI